jgi:hypothetical protein
MRKTTFVLTGTLIVLFNSTLVGANFLANPGFEAVNGAGQPQGWTTWSWNAGYTQLSSDCRTGNKSFLCVQTEPSDWAGGGGAYQQFPAEPGDSFYLSGWAKATGSRPRATLILAYMRASDVEIARNEYEIADWAPVADWSFGEITGIAPSGTAFIKYEVANNGGQGTAYFDDIYAEPTSAPPSAADCDFDGSNFVDAADLREMLSAWLASSQQYDLSDDGLVNMTDIAWFATYWLQDASPYPGYVLVWSDEFEGPGIDTGTWNHEIGAGGWGNNELQYYTSDPDNSYVADGKLVIVARKNHLGHDYTSARMTTRNKLFFTYGRLEASIKLPQGRQGIWPAFWMMPQNWHVSGWPGCGEMDIMEAINNFTRVHGTIHYGSSDPYNHDSDGGTYTPGGDLSADYHTYAIEWEQGVIRWYFDDINYYSSTSWWSDEGPFPAPFNKSFFFILNIAVGGNWPGNPLPDTPFPQCMYIDYIRVYKQTE